MAFSYVRKCSYFLVHIEFHKNEITMSGICFKTEKKREKEGAVNIISRHFQRERQSRY